MGHPATDPPPEAQLFLIVSRAHEPPLCRKVYVYSLDNLAQGQIIRSPRNMGKGHINLPAEGLALHQRRREEKPPAAARPLALASLVGGAAGRGRKRLAWVLL